MRRSVAVLMVLVICFLPISMETPSAQVAEAQAQAHTDFNSTQWLAIGCLLGVVGWAVATFAPPSPPASALVGKSPDYVAQYTEAYKKEGTQLQQNKAMVGCLIGTAGEILGYVVLFAAASSTY